MILLDDSKNAYALHKLTYSFIYSKSFVQEVLRIWRLSHEYWPQDRNTLWMGCPSIGVLGKIVHIYIELNEQIWERKSVKHLLCEVSG